MYGMSRPWHVCTSGLIVLANPAKQNPLQTELFKDTVALVSNSTTKIYIYLFSFFMNILRTTFQMLVFTKKMLAYSNANKWYGQNKNSQLFVLI